MHTPYLILKEQADVLTEMTNGLLVGEVDRWQSGKLLHTSLMIRVPALDNYHYSVLEMSHSIRFYPIRISQFSDDLTLWIDCQTEAEFEQSLVAPEIERELMTTRSLPHQSL